MKKIIALIVMGLLVGSALTGPAVAGKKKKKAKQTVEGHIAMQAPPADATTDPNGCYAGVHRRMAIASQEQVNGVVGYHFDVDKKTWKSKFKLVPAAEGIDIDIIFYTEFGTVEQATDTAYAPPTVSYEERDDKGEKGKVPPKMTKAIVCMKTGQDADFVYKAGG